MKYINNNDFNLRISNRDEIDINNMSDEIRNYYFNLYSLYMDLFIKYLLDKTKIKEYDDKIDNYNLKFKKCDSDDLDFYQMFSRDYTDYYYLRNNLYIYRLAKEEQDFLKNILITKNFELNQEVINFIESTYKKVIFEKINNNELSNVNYATNSALKLARNDSVIIGIRYNEYDNELEDEEWMDNYIKQKEVLQKDCLELSKNISETLNCNCTIFEYDDESVKKNSNLDYNTIKL